jgi:phospholipid N-methyltransferase
MAAVRQSFLHHFLRNPRSLGAVAPATPALARSVGAAAHAAWQRHSPTGVDSPARSLKMLELGAGTGALTQQIRLLNPVLIEQNEAWAALLRVRFAQLEVRQECATTTLHALDEPVGVVSSIPLWNNPQSRELRDLLLARYREGLVKFCVLYTYGWTDPLRGSEFRECKRVGFVPRSLPPAHVWLYE